MSVTSVNPATNATNEYYLTRQSQMESNVRSYPRKLPLAIAKAQGCWVTDVEGTQYLDCLAGAGTLALGHNHPAVIQSIQDTLVSGLPLHTLDLTTPLKDAFTEALLAYLPGGKKNIACSSVVLLVQTQLKQQSNLLRLTLAVAQ